METKSEPAAIVLVFACERMENLATRKRQVVEFHLELRDSSFEECNLAKRKNSTAATGSTAVNVGYEARLWQMADALRGSMDAAEYKHVAPGLIFVKYVSDAIETKRAERAHQKADHFPANTPFNDSDWRGDLLREDTPWVFGVPLSGNANFGGERWHTPHHQGARPQTTIGRTHPTLVQTAFTP